ncbi:hypothetical protein B0H17DRAFT_1185859 [Mycena rosella]|uniref:Uncharacterized protein n=1 Tax=Mycena rosella TaxID=1033263 RepID=A0AAD7CPN2_MYCRO|nr:hypothetical protein B0H17DRAFT_1185859 [Mycena rosella]
MTGQLHPAPTLRRTSKLLAHLRIATTREDLKPPTAERDRPPQSKSAKATRAITESIGKRKGRERVVNFVKVVLREEVFPRASENLDIAHIGDGAGRETGERVVSGDEASDGPKSVGVNQRGTRTSDSGSSSGSEVRYASPSPEHGAPKPKPGEVSRRMRKTRRGGDLSSVMGGPFGRGRGGVRGGSSSVGDGSGSGSLDTSPSGCGGCWRSARPSRWWQNNDCERDELLDPA